MTWGAILLYFALIGVIGWVYYKWAIDREEFFKCNFSNFYYSEPSSEINDEDIRTNKIIAYCVWGWGGLSLLIFCCYYHKIRLAIAVLKVSFFSIIRIKDCNCLCC